VSSQKLPGTPAARTGAGDEIPVTIDEAVGAIAATRATANIHVLDRSSCAFGFSGVLLPSLEVLSLLLSSCFL
jgi:hypothetical protein